MPQNQIEAATIAVDNKIEAAFDDAVKLAMLAVVLADQKTRAQHWRQRQRNHDGDDDRRRNRDGEFVEQPSDDAAHQQQRNEHRDQRYADR